VNVKAELRRTFQKVVHQKVGDAPLPAPVLPFPPGDDEVLDFVLDFDGL